METKALQKLIRDCNATTAEIDRMKAMIVDLTAEDQKLLKTLDVDNPEQFRNLSDVRLKRELAQSKIPQFQHRLEGLREELRLLGEKTVFEYNSEVDVRIEAAIKKLSDAILPFIPDGNKAFEQARLFSLQIGGPIADLRRLKFESHGSDPIEVANVLLDRWGKLSTAVA